MCEVLFRQCSSLEKVFLNDFNSCEEYTSASALKGEEFSYQIAYKSDIPREQNGTRIPLKVKVESNLRDMITIYLVGNVASELPAYPGKCDENYITTKSGLFPDILRPIQDGEVTLFNSAYHSIWISVKISESCVAGKYPIRVTFLSEDSRVNEQKIFELEVIDNILPKQQLIFTQWFHADCIATYYGVKTFGEKHWELIDKFMEMAAEHGVNMLLTPVFTPPLDTEVGGERPTVQLVDVTKEKDTYSFSFDKLIRWIDLGRKNGIKYFEISHLFTQWGAVAAPKIVAEVNGKTEKIFGWDTKSDSKEYIEFLNCFLPKLIEVIKEKNIEDSVYFHISDEPSAEQVESYKKARDIIYRFIKDFKTIDALSDFEFYQKKLIETPVCAINHIEPFINAKVEPLWAYNCCSQCDENVSNRFMAMPSYRNRIIGYQLYKYGINGFLHWGYNFYYSVFSKKQINPFLVTDADGADPSGDAFSVYPGKNGPIPSIRLKVFNEALQDIRAMELLENYMPKADIVRMIDSVKPISFKEYPHCADYILNLREKINLCIKKMK